jgi:hydrogenase maturation protein HypF
LPHTPLHHLLLADFAGALVMTSGNVSDEPIAFEDADARRRLAPIADVFLLHDRGIHARTDDSVARSGSIIRRSRGYVPRPLTLPHEAERPLLACGAQQKNTFCVAKGAHAWVSHHIGDLEHWTALSAFRDGIEHFERLFAVAPEIVAHDLHPGYQSTAYALEREHVQLVAVQHHHAHMAACLAEHGVDGEAVGAIFDGTGYGTDGTVWGGELLVGDLHRFERAGSLLPVRLPGGTAAIREPWRMAYAWLAEAYGDRPPIPERLHGLVGPAEWRALDGIRMSDAVSPVTTSIGRLFDAVAALCGLRHRVSYEGQAAVELEWAASRSGDARRYELELDTRGPALLLDPRATISALVRPDRLGAPA